MLCELSKLDLWVLLRGLTPPTYEWINKLSELNIGHYQGGFHDRWVYNEIYNMPNLTEEELWELYQEMLQSTKALYSKIMKIEL